MTYVLETFAGNSASIIGKGLESHQNLEELIIQDATHKIVIDNSLSNSLRRVSCLRVLKLTFHTWRQSLLGFLELWKLHNT